MTALKIGILGTAKIARTKIIPALKSSNKCDVYAISGRDYSHTKEICAQLSIPKAFKTHEELITSPDIDLIYIPLPNHLHLDYSLKALKLGKHVLCEKPATTSLKDLQIIEKTLLDYPAQYMEAYMVRFHPQWQKAKELISAGAIGQPKTISAQFGYYNIDPANIRNIAKYGGGALLDIGCYPIFLSRYLLGKNPIQVQANLKIDSETATDQLGTALLDFETCQAHFSFSTQTTPSQEFTIYGTEGALSIQIPFNPPTDKETELTLTTGSNLLEKETQKIKLQSCNQYRIMVEDYIEKIAQEARPTITIKDSLDTMKIIEAIRKSNQEKRSVAFAEIT